MYNDIFTIQREVCTISYNIYSLLCSWSFNTYSNDTVDHICAVQNWSFWDISKDLQLQEVEDVLENLQETLNAPSGMEISCFWLWNSRIARREKEITCILLAVQSKIDILHTTDREANKAVCICWQNQKMSCKNTSICNWINLAIEACRWRRPSILVFARTELASH